MTIDPQTDFDSFTGVFHCGAALHEVEADPVEGDAPAQENFRVFRCEEGEQAQGSDFPFFDVPAHPEPLTVAMVNAIIDDEGAPSGR